MGFKELFRRRDKKQNQKDPKSSEKVASQEPAAVKRDTNKENSKASQDPV